MKAIRFHCPKCRAQHSAPAALAGQGVFCKGCSGPLIVPGGVDVPEPEVSIPTPVEAGPGPKSRPIRRDVVRAGAALGLVATVGILACLVRSRGHRAEGPALAIASPTVAPQDDQDVLTFLEPQVEPEEVVVLPAAEPLPVEPAPAAAPAPAPRDDPARPLVIKRRQKLDQDALRRQLAELPELAAQDKTETALVALHGVALPTSQGGRQSQLAQGAGRTQRATPANRSDRRGLAATGPAEGPIKPGMHVARDEGAPPHMLAMIHSRQPELAALPWRMGDECHLGRESAEDLQVVSRALRTVLSQAVTPNDSRPDAEKLRRVLLGNLASQPKFLVPAAIPALQQLLMAERTPVRQVLVEALDRIEGPEAAKALARLSVFDLAPEVREKALLALKTRKADAYRPAMLEGFRYPWAPVADHAAEGLVALGDVQAVPELVALLDQPDPARPRTEVRDGKPVTLTRSLVQVNHLQNCILCHAPSGNQTLDMVRGRVPDESQPLPPPVEYYGSTSPGLFVRAEVTYLRQDFSVTQPVQDHGPWPAYQRYDYLVTETPTSRWSRDFSSGDKDEYPQRESVLFALRELTGQDLGPRSIDWKSRPHAGTPVPHAQE